MGLGNIISAFNDTVGTIGGVLLNGRTGPYTNYEGVTNRIIPGNWRLSLPYSFKVVGVSSPIFGSSSPLSGLFKVIGSPSGGGLFDEFYLPINPQNITQEENFAINITPTQRGIVAEHNGVVLKDLVIAGTTGQRPSNTISGYEYFLQLRNYFRSYAELKKSTDQKNSQLIFMNRKDNEYLIVEPVKFVMERDSGRPFLYNYKIVMKALGLRRPNFANGILGDFFNKIDSIIERITDYIQGSRVIMQGFTNFFTGIEREFVATIMEPIETVGLAFKQFRGLPFTLADMPSSIINQLSDRTVQAFLDNAKQEKKNGNVNFAEIKIPIDTQRESTANGANALSILTPQAKADLSVSVFSDSEKNILNNFVADALKKTKSFYEELLTNITSLRDDLSDKSGVGDTYYDDFVGRTPEFTASSTRTPREDDVEAMIGLNLAERAIKYILSTESLFNETVEQYIDDVEDKYKNNLELINPQSVDEIILPNNATLEDLAAEYLGSADRWIDIAIVNNLIAPYIDEDSTSDRIKRPGDKILIPKETPAEPSNIPTTRTIALTEDFNTTEKNLGVDIKINSDFDFIINSTNDIELIAGGSNAGQAVIIKIALEKGSLKYHTQIGVGLGIGEKIRNGIDIRDDLILSILSDARFSGIKNLAFTTEGSTIKILMDLIVRNLATPVPLTLRV